MNKKVIIFVLAVFTIYILCYFTIAWPQYAVPKTPLEQPLDAQPFVIKEHCPDTYQSFGFRNINEQVCFGKKGLIAMSGNTEEILLDSKATANITILAVRRNLLVLLEKQRVSMRPITAANTEIATIQLLTNETVLAVFSTSDDVKTYLFISTELTVSNSHEDKSRIHVIQIDTESNKVASQFIYSSKYIERVSFANLTETAIVPFVSTEASYPFLEPYFRVYAINKQQLESQTDCTVTNIINTVQTPKWQEKCSSHSTVQTATMEKQKNGILKQTVLEDLNSHTLFAWQNSRLLFSTNQTLVWENINKRVQLIKYADTLIQSLQPQLLVSTRIGKRVYNCIDFGESPQISLRVCIPIYEQSS